MNRRNFLSLVSAGIAGIALDQAIPLGRVWSFPNFLARWRKPGIIIPPPEIYATGNTFLNVDWISMEALRTLRNNLQIVEHFSTDWEENFRDKRVIGSKVLIQAPEPGSWAAYGASYHQP
jgi:hypothetical protein